MKQHPLLQFFAYDHLPEELQAVSEPFAKLAHEVCRTACRRQFFGQLLNLFEGQLGMVTALPQQNLESQRAALKICLIMQALLEHGEVLVRDTCVVDEVLRLLLEAKDCAVRSVIYEEPMEEQ